MTIKHDWAFSLDYLYRKNMLVSSIYNVIINSWLFYTMISMKMVFFIDYLIKSAVK